MNLPALMGGGEEMLKPVLDPLDRPVQFHRHPWQQHFLGIKHHDLRAETAADEGCDHADLPFVEAEHAGETVAHEHRRLCGIPDRHLVGARIPLRDDAAGFDRRRDAVLVEKAAPDDMVGGGHGGRIVTLGLPHMRETLEPTSSWTSADPPASPFSRSTTAGSCSSSTSISSSASSAIYRLSAITITSGSPTWRTLSLASGTWVRSWKTMPAIGGGGTNMGPGCQ